MNVYQEINNVLESENIKYDSNKLKKICNYIEKEYINIKKIDMDMLDHVVGVAKEVAKLRIDDTSIYAALLHGVIKCEDYSQKNITELFGKEISDIIITVNKLSLLNLNKKEQVNSEILRNMFMAIAKDIRTVIIKLADRLCVMKNIKNIEKEEIKISLAKECLAVYAPISHRLGMSVLKSELEDISFRILYNDEYQNIKDQIDEKEEVRKNYIQDRIKEVDNALKKENIVAEIYGRPKHFYSIYKKIKEKNCNVEDLFDLLAIRVIVSSIKDCYSVLGIVHDMYKPLPGRFKDYIAVPKTNMYQSLHTTVFGAGGKPFEIQIRTWDMHNIAESGVAAHFSYKEKTNTMSDADKKIVWLKEVLKIQQDLSDVGQSVENIKVELFGEEVFVFTPKGDIKSLLKGSTPIDFAYAIHQKIAEKMVGAKINSKIVPLNTKLENTDIVEIITSSSSKGPNRDWLKFVKTSSAKSKIIGYLKKEGKEENIFKGKDEFDKLIKKQKISKEELLKDIYVTYMLKKCNFNNLEETYENIGFGSISAKKVVNKLIEVYREKNKKQENNIIKSSDLTSKNRNSELIIVENIDNCKIQFAKCCNPILGDDIIGYITNAKGVSIHRQDCKNLFNLDKNKKINVLWKKKSIASFVANIKVRANAREKIITDVINKINELKLNITEMTTKVTNTNENEIEVAINISDTVSLQNVIKELKKIDSVFEVRRMR